MAEDVDVGGADGADVGVGDPLPPPPPSSPRGGTDVAHIIVREAPLFHGHRRPKSSQIVAVVVAVWAVKIAASLVMVVVVVGDGCMLQGSSEVEAGEFGEGGWGMLRWGGGFGDGGHSRRRGGLLGVHDLSKFLKREVDRVIWDSDIHFFKLFSCHSKCFLVSHISYNIIFFLRLDNQDNVCGCGICND